METVLLWIAWSIAGFCLLILLIMLFVAEYELHKTTQRLKQTNKRYVERFGLDDED